MNYCSNFKYLEYIFCYCLSIFNSTNMIINKIFDTLKVQLCHDCKDSKIKTSKTSSTNHFSYTGILSCSYKCFYVFVEIKSFKIIKNKIEEIKY